MHDLHARTLIGWKEIASYLNCSLSSARRREQEGLPVFRVGGSVRAYADEIDSWIRKGRAQNSPGAAAADVEPATSGETDLQELVPRSTAERDWRRFVVVSLGISGSELERLVDSLKASEERYRKLLEKVPVWIWETDARGRYKYSNGEVSKILGYRPEEIAGRMPGDVGIVPDDLRPVEDALGSLRGDGDAIKQLEYHVFHRDGTVRRLRTYAEAVWDADGDFAGIRGVTYDVTNHESPPGKDSDTS